MKTNISYSYDFQPSGSIIRESRQINFDICFGGKSKLPRKKILKIQTALQQGILKSVAEAKIKFTQDLGLGYIRATVSNCDIKPKTVFAIQQSIEIELESANIVV